MTKRANHSQRSFGARLLAVAMTLAMAGLAVAPGSVTSVQAQSCSPQIGIDGPAPGDVISGSTTFSGWAVDLTSPGGSGVDQVRLYRDAPPEEGGTALAVATVGIARPDIDAANSLTNSNSGWSATADFSDVPSGDYTVYIYAHTICGWTYATQAVGVSSSVAAGDSAPAGAPSIQIALDSPTAGAMVNNGQAVTIAGWAVDPAGSGSGISSVRMFLDGQEGTGTPLGFANYGKSRPDVVSATGNPAWDTSGFDLVWPVAGVSPGSHVLYIYAQSSATGQWDHTTVPVTVTSAGAGNTLANNAATGVTNANAVVKIITPQGNAPLTGPTQVRGFALDCSTGTPASTVRVYAGTNTSGQALGNTSVGSSASDLNTACAGHGLTGSANAGFAFNLDPTMLGGVNAITIAADTTAGPATTTLTFTGGAPNTNTAAGTAPATTGTTNCTNSAATSPFAVTCGQPSTATFQNAPGTQQNTAYANQNCAQGQNMSAYMQTAQNYTGGQASGIGTCVPGTNTAQNGGYPSTPMYNNTTGYNGQQQYPYNNNGTGYNYNSGTNGYNYSNTGYNSQQYPYNNTTQYGYNQQQYPYTNANTYGYNQQPYGYNTGYNNGYGNGYNGGVGYSNSTPYGYPYNSSYNNAYGYNGYNTGYTNGYGAGYNGYPNTGAPYGAPYGYQSPYIYNGNAGTNYGSPYGYPNGNPYGNPYGYPY